MKKHWIMFLSFILRWRSIWYRIIPPLLLVPSAFQVQIGFLSFSRGNPILWAKWRLMQQIVAPLSTRAVVSAIFLFSVL